MAKKRRRPENSSQPIGSEAEPASSDAVEPVTAAPSTDAALDASTSSRSFFALEDWIAAAVTFLISGAVFLRYVCPSVTLQDSGEFVTGAFNFGVPHPPGYPLWAFLAWVWSQLVRFGNPAYRISLFSVLTGASLTAIMTLLMTRSILTMLRASPWADKIEDSLKHWIALTVGASAALLFAFNRGVWCWACVPECRVLNQFLFVLITCFFFAWMMRPERHALMYATIFVYALSTANHQTVVVMGLPLLVGAFVVGVWLEGPGGLRRSFSSLCELIVSFLVGWAVGIGVYAWLEAPTADKLFEQKVKALILFGPEVTALPVMLLAVAAAGALLVVGHLNRWLSLRRATICAGLFLLGCAFYMYMPIASSTNPPMNWGFTSTRQGFLHHITRGQYEKLNIAAPLSQKSLMQISLFAHGVFQQYTIPLSALAVVTLIFLVMSWKQLLPRGRAWLIFVWAAFLTTSVGLLTIINPELDKQQQEITIKFFAPAHGFIAMLIGYGIALVIGAAVAYRPQLPRLPIRVVTALLPLLAIIPFTRNYALCEQRGHDFGYQFGYRMFYPGGDYPPMDKDAVLYGGTDPGRFVPTYMILAESRVGPKDRFQDPNFDPEGGSKFDRRDVYIITQNALADNTYMNYIRDHYDYSRPTMLDTNTLRKFEPWQRVAFRLGWHLLGRDTTYPKEPIWIPNDNDLQRAFQEYVTDVQRRQAAGQQLSPDEQVEVVGGAVQVRGVGGVMKINGILTKWIFDHNKDKHSFYVEESYPIDWMYPYLEPYGIIMKINKEPLPSPEQAPELWTGIVARDTAYWNKLCADFAARPEFRLLRDGATVRGDSDAQKTFSKLRSAIGGIYASRHMLDQAVYAFTQALQLCPDSPEANYRLAQIYMEVGQYDNAINLLTTWQKLDPLNRKISDALTQVNNLKQAVQQIKQLETMRLSSPRDSQLLAQLAQLYVRASQAAKVPPMVDTYLSQPGLTVTDMLFAAQIYLNIAQLDRAAGVFELMLQRYPQESESYYWLALLRANQMRFDVAFSNLQKAIELNPQLRDQARSDPRFGPLRNQPRFGQLVGAPAEQPLTIPAFGQ